MLRWVVRALGVLLALLVVAATVVFVLGHAQITRRYDVPLRAFAAASDSGAIERGRRVAATVGCSSCHGAAMTGDVFMEEPWVGRLIAPNITRIAGGYSDAELERLIHHGVKRDGRPALGMPTLMLQHVSDTELADLLALLRSLTPIEHALPRTVIGPLGYLGIATGEFAPEAGRIQHAALRPPATPPADTLALGLHLALSRCSECHGQDLAGDPGFGPDLAIVAGYPADSFATFLRTGRASGGRRLELMSEMCLQRFHAFDDHEVRALHAALVARANAGGVKPASPR